MNSFFLTAMSIIIKIQNLDTRKEDYVVYPRSKRVGPSLKTFLKLKVTFLKQNICPFHFLLPLLFKCILHDVPQKKLILPRP